MKAIFSGEANIEFVGRSRIFAIVSGILVFASILLVAVRGINFGIDFAGGYEIQVKFPQSVTDGQIKKIIQPVVGDARVQRFGEEDANEFLIMVREHGTISDQGKARLTADLEELAGGRDKMTVLSIAESGESLKIGFTSAMDEQRVRSVIEAQGLRIIDVASNERVDQPVYEVRLSSLADQIEQALRTELGLPKLAQAPQAPIADTPAPDVDDAAPAATDAAGAEPVDTAADDGTEPVAEAPAAADDGPQPVAEAEPVLPAAQKEAAVAAVAPTTPGNEIVQRVEFVGPQVGAQLRNQGVMAVIWALFFILLYIGVRFDLFFAPGAIVALIHDVCITVGVFSLLQLEFNLPIIAAILAIIGYSLNDTIVVYDRVRENMLRLRGRELSRMVNTSLNQTLSRTLLTSFTTLLVVSALLVFGGGIIRDFSIALLIGVLVGTYSSVGIATPVYIQLRERYGKKAGAASSAGTAAA